ncbi:hypothetical protein TNCV_2514301 [Trichonephila clavipes]|nr:hypothetical protein TNCV_2514301 [Trichonephila clavipes]
MDCVSLYNAKLKPGDTMERCCFKRRQTGLSPGMGGIEFHFRSPLVSIVDKKMVKQSSAPERDDSCSSLLSKLVRSHISTG